MAADMNGLRELMDERSRPAYERPIPWDRLRTRRRNRRGPILLAVAAVLVVAVTGQLLLSRDSGETAQVVVRDPIPAQFTEADGAVYRRVATADLDSARATMTTVKVNARGKPLAILADCPPKGTIAWATAKVPGVAKRFTLFPASLFCDGNRARDLMPLPPNARTVDITFDLRDEEGKWRFGIYEWTPAVPMRAAPPPTRPPARFGEFKRLDQATAVWPGDREVTITVPNRGRQIAFMHICEGAIGDRVAPELRINGRLDKGARICQRPWGGGGGYLTLGAVPQGRKTVTISVRVTTPIREYDKRPGTLTVAVYEATA